MASQAEILASSSARERSNESTVGSVEDSHDGGVDSSAQEAGGRSAAPEASKKGPLSLVVQGPDGLLYVGTESARGRRHGDVEEGGSQDGEGDGNSVTFNFGTMTCGIACGA